MKLATRSGVLALAVISGIGVTRLALSADPPNPEVQARIDAAQARLKAKQAAATQPTAVSNADVAELRGEVESLRAENARLKAELARLKNPQAAGDSKPRPVDKGKSGDPIPMPKIGDAEQNITAWVNAPRRLINDGAITTQPLFSTTTSETTDGKTISVAVDTGGGNLRDILSYTIQNGKIVRISRLLPN